MSSAPTSVKEASGLTLADVGKKSEMEQLGWSVNQAKDKTWSAHEKAGDLRSFGPAKSISALHTQVMIAAGKGENGKVKKVGSSKLADGEFKENSQPILTGTENAVFEDLKNLGKDYRQSTMEILRLQKLQKTQKDALKPMINKFKDELETSLDENGKEEYFVVVEVDGEDIDVVLGKKEEETIFTRKHRA